MNLIVKYLRKIIVFIIGIVVFILGVILIPLPGPGLLVCFAGLFILSLEFDWAKPYLERTKSEMNKVISKAKARQSKINKKQ